MTADDITLLCKVVDNFGDIGFVYRLARSISALRPEARLRLIVSDLRSFSLLCPAVQPCEPVQRLGAWRVYDWGSAELCARDFRAEFPALILECFQCGRPDWLEALLFPPETDAGRNPPCQIISIDYLTAEAYAEDFHCLQSLTRRSAVRKVNFMPGFTAGTGGLLLHSPRMYGRTGGELFRLLVFTYDKDLAFLMRACVRFARSRPVAVDVAQGAGLRAARRAFRGAKQDAFALHEMAFLPQTEFDRALMQYDTLFVRGEDSLARACLSGIPFVWNAYAQDDDYQLVKVRALLARMEPHFSASDFALLRRLWLAFNAGSASQDTLCGDCLAFLHSAGSETMRGSFRAFADSLYANGDFARHLLDFIASLP